MRLVTRSPFANQRLSHNIFSLSLNAGEYGRYPDLEQTVKAKLIEMVPDKEQRKIRAIASEPSVDDANTEREGLQDWVTTCAATPGGSIEDTATKITTAPIRAVAHINLGSSNNVAVSTTTANDIQPTSSNCSSNKATEIFRKEKLSTKVIVCLLPPCSTTLLASRLSHIYLLRLSILSIGVF